MLSAWLTCRRLQPTSHPDGQQSMTDPPSTKTSPLGLVRRAMPELEVGPDFAGVPIPFDFREERKDVRNDTFSVAERCSSHYALGPGRVLTEPRARGSPAALPEAPGVVAPRRKRLCGRVKCTACPEPLGGARSEVNREPWLAVLVPLHVENLDAVPRTTTERRQGGLVSLVDREAETQHISEEAYLQCSTQFGR